MIASCHVPMRHVTYQCVMRHDCAPHMNASRNESSDVWVRYMPHASISVYNSHMTYMPPSVCMTHTWICHIWAIWTRYRLLRLFFLKCWSDSKSREVSHVTHTWMSHVTHMNESHHTHECEYSHILMIHVIPMNESCHTYEWAMSHIWMSHVTCANESCHTWINRVTHVNTHVNESCHTYEWVMPPPPKPPPTPAQQLEHGKRPPPWGLLE